jgi:hypothetical protein
MIDLRTSFRQVSAAFLLTAGLWHAVPSGVAAAAPGGMLSTTAASGSVQEALLVKEDSTATDRQMEAETGRRLSPGKVALISTALPGYGQIYNHAAWKLPIYYGLMGYFAYHAVDYNGKYNNYRHQYLADPAAPGAAALAVNRDSYRKKRNTQIVWLCIAYVAGIVDAYVDTQLYDFDKVIDEKVGAANPNGGPAPIVSVSMKF